MQKRTIRLKELGTNINKLYTPTLEYLENCPLLKKNEIYEIKTDEEGNQYSIFGNQSENKIFLLGASTVECLYMGSSKKLHSVLEKTLLINGYNYEVKNLGTSGTHTLNIINLIINKLIDKAGSTVILVLPSNDEGPLQYEKNYFSSHVYHATILPALDKKVKREVDINAELYTRNLGLIKGICDQLKLKLFITSICYTNEAANLNRLNSIAKEYCYNNSIPFLDLEKDFQENQNYFYDKLHFLPEGAAYFSEKLFNFIKDELTQTNEKNLTFLDFKYSHILEKNMVWSETITNISHKTKIKLIIDFEQIDTSKAPALYAVDYFCTPTSTTLIKSANPEIGYYKYITGKPKKRIERVLDIDIPSNCEKLKVGIRSWEGKGIIIHNAFLSIIN